MASEDHQSFSLDPSRHFVNPPDRNPCVFVCLSFSICVLTVQFPLTLLIRDRISTQISFFGSSVLRQFFQFRIHDSRKLSLAEFSFSVAIWRPAARRRSAFLCIGSVYCYFAQEQPHKRVHGFNSRDLRDRNACVMLIYVKLSCND